MKIINITLGRDNQYITSAAAMVEADWTATVYVDNGTTYPDSKKIPSEIAQAMAEAAYATLSTSSFLTPVFVSDVSVQIEEAAPSTFAVEHDTTALVDDVDTVDL